MSNNRNFIGCDAELDKARLVIFGAPFDGTTTYRPGTRFAPARIREESFGIETYSPYLDKDLLDINVHDAGDLDLPFGNTERVLAEIGDRSSFFQKMGKLPVMLGGEHLITLPAVAAAKQAHGEISVIQLDAHADLREDYLGERLSHSTVMRRICEIVGGDNVYQLGIRSGERSEFEFAASNTHMTKFSLDGTEDIIKRIGKGKVYLTIDLDVLDPSEFSGTGTPEAGGVSFSALHNALERLGQLSIVGCDMNELCPPYDASGASTALACKVLRELLLILSK